MGGPVGSPVVPRPLLGSSEASGLPEAAPRSLPGASREPPWSLPRASPRPPGSLPVASMAPPKGLPRASWKPPGASLQPAPTHCLPFTNLNNYVPLDIGKFLLSSSSSQCRLLKTKEKVGVGGMGEALLNQKAHLLSRTSGRCAGRFGPPRAPGWPDTDCGAARCPPVRL